MIDIKKECRKIAPLLSSIRQDFHKNPELSEKEYRTMDEISRILDSWGIEYQKGVAETGIVAIVRGKKEGKTVALRSDIDALPITEDNDVPYKSENDGISHACGHDAHITIALGAAKIIKSMEDVLCGNVKFFFQPAEETVGGAERMIKAGCMENPKVEHVLGLHVSPNVEVGKLELRYGKMNASSDMITIIARGKSAHGANPEKSIDPIVIAANIILALQTIVSRNLSPLNSAVFTIGSLHAGTKGNIIPDDVRMECILRTLDNDTRAYMKTRICNIVENVARAYGGEGKVIIQESYAPLINDDETVAKIEEVAKQVVGIENISHVQSAELFAEDFSYFTQVAPSCFYNLGCGNEKRNIVHPLHNSKFDIDEECLVIGVEMQVRGVLKLLEEYDEN